MGEGGGEVLGVGDEVRYGRMDVGGVGDGFMRVFKEGRSSVGWGGWGCGWRIWIHGFVW